MTLSDVRETLLPPSSFVLLFVLHEVLAIGILYFRPDVPGAAPRETAAISINLRRSRSPSQERVAALAGAQPTEAKPTQERSVEEQSNPAGMTCQDEREEAKKPRKPSQEKPAETQPQAGEGKRLKEEPQSVDKKAELQEQKMPDRQTPQKLAPEHVGESGGSQNNSEGLSRRPRFRAVPGRARRRFPALYDPFQFPLAT